MNSINTKSILRCWKMNLCLLVFCAWWGEPATGFSLNVWIGSKRFRKGGKYVCSTVCTLPNGLRVSGLCIDEAREVLNN